MKLCTLRVASLLLSVGMLIAQTPTGTVQGNVSDQSGAPVADAAVKVTNTGTNETKELRTDSSGHYLVPFLNPGVYTVAVEAQGFRSETQSGVKIDVGQNRSIDVSLQIGQVSERVEVQATATPLDVNNATLGQVIDRAKVIDLPLNGRNPFSLATLVPGVNDVGGASTPHIGGSRNAVNEQQLDGVSNILPENNVGNTVSAYTPIVDSVQEFSVQTNSLSAEYGRFGGGVINLVTKSGTNELHGGLFDFARNGILNANNFFANRSGQARPDSNEQQYGGTIGGPIVVPKLYDGHNRSFFFFGFQGDTATRAAIATDTVPTAAERAGNFTGLSTIYDPKSVSQDASGNYVRAAFANNQIPTTRFDAVALNAVKYFPLPNTGAPGALTNNFVSVGNAGSDSYQWDSRVDHNFTQNWHSFFRLSHAWNTNNPFFDYGTVASQGYDGPSQGGSYSFSMDHTFTLSPTTVVDLRYGFARSYVTRTALGQGFLPSSLGLPASLDGVAAQRALQFPTFQFSNGAGLGNGGYVPLVENPLAHSITGSVTKIAGKHNLKFGGEWRKLLINFSQYGYPAGQFSFDQSWTQRVVSNADGSGNPFASFLLGLPNGGQVTHEPTAADASGYFALYVQDDWKISSKLTVNLGLRWDVETPRTERYNRLSYWDPSLPSPLQGKIPAGACLGCGDLRGQMLFAGTSGSQYGRSQGPIQWKDLGPRVGIAYHPFSSTVVRSGFGISYAPSALQAAGTTGAPGVQGFGSSTQVQSSFDNQRTIAPNFSLSNPFPSGFNLPLGAAGGALTQVGLGIGESFFNSYRNPYSIEWNLNIQQQLPGQMTFEIGYLGNRGLFLVDGETGQPYSQLNPAYAALGNQLLNTVPNPFYGIITTPGSPLAQPTVTYNRLLRPFPQYDGVSSFRKPGADSIYNGLTLRLDKRFSNGLTFLISFTGAKSIDDSAAAVGYLGPISGTRADQYNRRLERAVSPQDIARRLVISTAYELPFGRGKAFLNSAPKFANLLIGGWQVNGIISWQTGTPLILGGAQNQTNLFAAAQRPNNNGQSAAIANQSISQWFNTAVFSQPAPFTFGNTSRTLPDVRNPGIANADLSLFKNNRFGPEQRYNVQFRIEAFNALNHAQWGTPNTSIQAGSAFGAITSTGVSARQVQLAAKFYF